MERAMPRIELFDVIIIGAGQAGGPLSTAMAESGRSVAIIERVHVGGTCINEGCMPSKAMVASGRVAALAARGREYGIQTGPISVDLAAIRDRKRAVVERMRSGSQTAIEQRAGVELIMGEATFTGLKQVRVTGADGAERDLEAGQWVFINSGARPAIPTIPGIDTVPFLDSTSVMELDVIPDHLVVLGGGAIALEFAQMFRRFGSAVTVVQRGGRLLSREDEDVSAAMAEMLEADGIKVVLNAKAKAVRPEGEGVALEIAVGDQTQTVAGSHLLVAIGRTLNSDRLNLASTGVATGAHGEIVVNERLETSAEGIFALGDVHGGPAFTHMSYDDFRIVRDNLLRGGSRTTGDRPTPWVIFTDPELARIGLNESEAKEQGVSHRVAKMGMDSVARAILSLETTGFIKVLISPETDQILGATIVGVEGGELMTMFQLAMMGGLTAGQLGEMIIAHPTLAESINNVVSSS
jgi:pyruvate/2-oxoglutarate dehydrogenase complex dihydrolipoamide dehydrogenase (E3) component